MQYTNTVYQNPGVDIRFIVDYGCIKANRKIFRGDLILVEQVLAARDATSIVNIVSQNDSLFIDLCPRKTDELKNVGNAANKVASNMFRTNDVYALGRTISMINHSCTPNSLCTFTHFKGFDIPITFIIIYAINDINAEDEVSIMYSPSVGHVENDYHNFTCNCTKTTTQRETTIRVLSNLANNEKSNMFKIHREIIKQYWQQRHQPVYFRIADDSVLSDNLKEKKQLVDCISVNELKSDESNNDLDLAAISSIIADRSCFKDVLLTQYLSHRFGLYVNSNNYIFSVRYNDILEQEHGVKRDDSDQVKMDGMMRVMQESQLAVDTYLNELTLEFHTAGLNNNSK